MTRHSISLATVLSLAFFAALTQGQTTCKFKPVTTFDYPGAPVTWALGIDSSNNIVG